MSGKRMLLSTRKDPPARLCLPQNPKQNLAVRQFLLHSPLPSPSLPSILPRHGKKPPRINTNKFLRYLAWLGIFTTIFVLFQQATSQQSPISGVVFESKNGRQFELIGTADQPEFASPVTVTDEYGRTRWTVSIPAGLSHPLPPGVYNDICINAEDVSQHVAEITHSHTNSVDYHTKDPNFIDLTEAQIRGLLSRTAPLASHTGGLPLCEKSLTYVLDTAEAGLGTTLMGMWLAFGLAQQQGRAFFVDDTNFPYGNYSSLFLAPPSPPRCQPPPWEHRTPCPRQAEHLIVSPATLHHVFNRSYLRHYTTKQIYKLARTGYEALFHLRPEDAKSVSSRLSDLRSRNPDVPSKEAPLIGIHIRRGDTHPYEFQYQHGYIPPSRYISAATHSSSTPSFFPLYSSSPPPSPLLILASDDADLYHSPEVNGTIRAQESIVLASKAQLQASSGGKSGSGGGGLGWEGGFFRDAFWSAGIPDSVKRKIKGSPLPNKGTATAEIDSDKDSKQEELQERDYKADPTPEAKILREYVGRAYLLDLAVLAGSDEVVCAVSSMGCRLLGVMIGWDALHAGKWKNIDGELGWRALF